MIHNYGDSMMYIYFCLSTILFICVLYLVSLLKKKRNQISWQSNERAYFNKEICKLWIILSVFSATYMIRGIWDTLSLRKNDSFGLLVWSVLNGLLYDFIPVMLIMYFHYRNFSKENNAKSKRVDKGKAKN